MKGQVLLKNEMVSEDLKIASIINDYFDGLLPNVTFEDPENALCETSYTGDTFSLEMEKYQNYPSIKKNQREMTKYKFTMHFFLIARYRKTRE